MAEYEFDIDMPSDDDDEAYGGPDAYLEGDDNVLELEVGHDDFFPPGDDTGINALQILRCRRFVAYLWQNLPISHLLALFDLQQLQPGTTSERSTNPGTNNAQGRITYGDLVRLLRSGPSQGRDEDDEDVDNDDDEYPITSDWNKQWFPPHTEPQARGVELLMGGEFGRVGNKIKTKKGSRNISRLFLDRSCRPQGTPSREELISVCPI